MSKVFALLVFCVIILQFSVSALLYNPWTKEWTFSQECGENKVYRSGSSCEPNCYDNDRVRICTMDFIVGCLCKEGFYRTLDGRCVADCSDASAEINVINPLSFLQTKWTQQ